MFKPLLFLPDEEPASAVAEPPAEEPQTVETPEPPVPAEPPAEQEQADAPEAEADSGATQEEDNADPLQLALDAIEEMAKENPEAAEKLREKLGVEEKPPEVETERWAWELEKSKGERDTLWSNAQAQYNQYAQPTVEKQLTDYFDTLNGNVRDAAGRLHKGEIDNPEAVGFDARDVVQALMPFIQGGQNAAYGLAQAAGHYSGFASLETHASHRLLTADERKQFSEARTSNNLAAAQELQLAAAGRGPSATAIAAEAKVEAEKDSGILEQISKVQSALSKNGNNSAGGAPKASSNPKDEQEAINWHATGKWSNAQMRAWRAKQ